MVREWNVEEGWGVIDSEHTPGGAWASFSEVDDVGFRSLTRGSQVSFEPKVAEQDGFHFRALQIRQLMPPR
ncbi:MAG: cold shock domain-containing protein [Aldersonia sp.]|nr:cold shock domain-containing protein [Aldersonia sp.]